MRRATYIAAILVTLFAAAPAAHADTAGDILAELQEAGLPSVSVTVATPPAATAADVATFNADSAARPPSLTIDAMLSPNPSAPQPVATVRFGKGAVTALPGLLRPPGSSGYLAVEDAQMPIWRMAIMSALRHRLAAGVTLAGVAMQPQFPNRPDSIEPDLWVAAPPASTWPPAGAPATMPATSVRDDIRLSLPEWAKAADVAVTDGPRRGRVGVISLSVPPLALNEKLPELPAFANQKQGDLNSRGGGLASVIVKVTEVGSGLPLLTSAHDADWGQHFLWAAPAVQPYVGRASGGGPATTAPVEEVVNTVEDNANTELPAP